MYAFMKFFFLFFFFVANMVIYLHKYVDIFNSITALSTSKR